MITQQLETLNVETNELGDTFITIVADGKQIRYKQSKKFKLPKASGVADNRLSVEGIRRAGHKISVQHYRAFYSHDVDRIIYLPKNTKYLRDPDLLLLPHGGYTRIALTLAVSKSTPFKVTTLEKEEEGICYGDTLYMTSHCSELDLFCYKTGVRQALDRVSMPLAKALLNGPLK